MLHHVEIYVSDLETSRTFYDFLLPSWAILFIRSGRTGCLIKKQSSTWFLYKHHRIS